MALGLGLCACTSEPETPATSSTTASSSSSTVRTAPPDALEDRDGVTVTPTSKPASPTWDATTRTDATAVATKAMKLFVRRDVSAEEWLTDLEPYLSPAALAAYEGTDPATGPKISLTGSVRLLGGGSAYLAKVHFPTTQGTYLVLLSRDGADGPWRVERFTPPERVGH